MFGDSPNKKGQEIEPTPELVNWLLDSDPAIRWQVMQDLMSDIQKLMPRITGGEKPETALERLLKESRKDLLIRASDFRRPPQGTRPRTGGEE